MTLTVTNNCCDGRIKQPENFNISHISELNLQTKELIAATDNGQATNIIAPTTHAPVKKPKSEYRSEIRIHATFKVWLRQHKKTTMHYKKHPYNTDKSYQSLNVR